MAALERALADAQQRHPKTATRTLKNTSARKANPRRGPAGKALPGGEEKAAASAREPRKPE
ncbi:hypothetical protein AB0F92_20540 [Kitasatospora aureofaciens]|uniref:hypothetical protein n=1 Tax=Kitasatospora aureofaciens TaxID=1894 RepID=UPI00340B70B6